MCGESRVGLVVKSRVESHMTPEDLLFLNRLKTKFRGRGFRHGPYVIRLLFTTNLLIYVTFRLKELVVK